MINFLHITYDVYYINIIQGSEEAKRNGRTFAFTKTSHSMLYSPHEEKIKIHKLSRQSPFLSPFIHVSPRQYFAVSRQFVSRELNPRAHVRTLK